MTAADSPNAGPGGVTAAMPPTAAAGATDADIVSTIVSNLPDVAGLSVGAFGEVASYLPGRKILGVRVDDDAVEVHIVARYGKALGTIAEQIGSALAPVLAGRPLQVFVDDILLPGEMVAPTVLDRAADGVTAAKDAATRASDTATAHVVAARNVAASGVDRARGAAGDALDAARGRVSNGTYSAPVDPTDDAVPPRHTDPGESVPGASSLIPQPGNAPTANRTGTCRGCDTTRQPLRRARRPSSATGLDHRAPPRSRR